MIGFVWNRPSFIPLSSYSRRTSRNRGLSSCWGKTSHSIPKVNVFIRKFTGELSRRERERRTLRPLARSALSFQSCGLCRAGKYNTNFVRLLEGYDQPLIPGQNLWPLCPLLMFSAWLVLSTAVLWRKLLSYWPFKRTMNVFLLVQKEETFGSVSPKPQDKGNWKNWSGSLL